MVQMAKCFLPQLTSPVVGMMDQLLPIYYHTFVGGLAIIKCALIKGSREAEMHLLFLLDLLVTDKHDILPQICDNTCLLFQTFMFHYAKPVNGG
jgi:hypothetical protein